jgi:hypothetical protein
MIKLYFWIRKSLNRLIKKKIKAMHSMAIVILYMQPGMIYNINNS